MSGLALQLLDSMNFSIVYASSGRPGVSLAYTLRIELYICVVARRFCIRLRTFSTVSYPAAHMTFCGKPLNPKADRNERTFGPDVDGSGIA